MKVRKYRTIPCKPVKCPEGCKPACILRKGLECCGKCICPNPEPTGKPNPMDSRKERNILGKSN